jgi:hypothetical protein
LTSSSGKLPDRCSAGRHCPLCGRQYTEVGAGISKLLIGVVSPVRQKIPDTGEVLGVLGRLQDAVPLRIEDRGHVGRQAGSDCSGACRRRSLRYRAGRLGN